MNKHQGIEFPRQGVNFDPKIKTLAVTGVIVNHNPQNAVVDFSITAKNPLTGISEIFNLSINLKPHETKEFQSKIRHVPNVFQTLYSDQWRETGGKLDISVPSIMRVKFPNAMGN